MTYTLELHEYTTSEVFTTKTGGTVRFKNANNASVDTSNAIVKPTTGGGKDFSYEKWLRLRITNDTTSGSTSAVISGLKFYLDGTNNMGTGTAVYVRTTTGAFAAPVEPSSTTAWVSAFTYNSTNKLALSTTAQSYSAVGPIGKWAVFSFRASTGIAVGLTGVETATFEYTETT